jgi:hypothetical protein
MHRRLLWAAESCRSMRQRLPREMSALIRALSLLMPGELHSFSLGKYSTGNCIAAHDDRAYTEVGARAHPGCVQCPLVVPCCDVMPVGTSAYAQGSTGRWRARPPPCRGKHPLGHLQSALDCWCTAPPIPVCLPGGQVLMDTGRTVVCSRSLALIYYLTKDWTTSHGGELVDLEAPPNAPRMYVPEFNS